MKSFGDPNKIGFFLCKNCHNMTHRLGENFCIRCGLEDPEPIQPDTELYNELFAGVVNIDVSPSPAYKEDNNE